MALSPALREAPYMETCMVIVQKSAEAIVATGRRDSPVTAKGRTLIRDPRPVNTPERQRCRTAETTPGVRTQAPTRQRTCLSIFLTPPMCGWPGSGCGATEEPPAWTVCPSPSSLTCSVRSGREYAKLSWKAVTAPTLSAHIVGFQKEFRPPRSGRARPGVGGGAGATKGSVNPDGGKRQLGLPFPSVIPTEAVGSSTSWRSDSP